MLSRKGFRGIWRRQEKRRRYSNRLRSAEDIRIEGGAADKADQGQAMELVRGTGRLLLMLTRAV